MNLHFLAFLAFCVSNGHVIENHVFSGRPYCSPANIFDEFCTNIYGSIIETFQLFTCSNECLFVPCNFIAQNNTK